MFSSMDHYKEVNENLDIPSDIYSRSQRQERFCDVCWHSQSSNGCTIQMASQTCYYCIVFKPAGFFSPLSFTTYGSRDSASCVFRQSGGCWANPFIPPPSLSLHKTPIVSCLLTNGKRKRGVLEQIRRQVAFITNVGNTQENHKRRTWAIEFPDRENSKKQPKTVWDYSHNSEFLPQ
jgi:hypothetical protein